MIYHHARMMFLSTMMIFEGFYSWYDVSVPIGDSISLHSDIVFALSTIFST